MIENTNSAPVREAARRLARLGLATHYLTPPTANKPNSGKRPIATGWQNTPFCAETDIAAPPTLANLGIRTGRVDGAPVCVVAVDLDSPEALTWAREHLPATPWRTLTGKGEHWLYRYPPATGTVRNRVNVALPDGTVRRVDLRADGGNLVVAPSVHYSGRIYAEAAPWDAVTPDMVPVFDPAWFGAVPQRGRPHSTAVEPDLPDMPSTPPSTRPGMLPEQFEARLFEQLNRAAGGTRGLTALRAMRKGEPYAQPGERNQALFEAVRLLCEWFPEANDDQLVAFARTSVLATGDKGEDAELETVRDGVRRAREKFAARDHFVLRLLEAGVPPSRELVDAGAQVRERLILTFPSGGHVLMRPDGGYSNAVIRTEVLKASIAQDSLLGWAERAGLAQWSFTAPDGSRRRVSWQTICERHSYVVQAWRGSLTASSSHVDGDTFVEAVAPRRADLAPRFDAGIDAWLRALGGDASERLLDWLATFPRLSDPTAALVMIGARKAGKNLLVDGLARLWKHGSASPFEATVTDFNEALQRCPLLFADEKLPEAGKQRAAIDAHLRELVTRRTHELNRKFQPVVTIEGCARIVVAMNHSRLEFGVGMNEESKAALAERLFVVEVQPAAREFLETLPARTTQSWVAGDGIARHVLWLSENRRVVLGDRLLVEGNGQRLIDRASNAGGVNADVCQWLCSYLGQPEALAGPAKPFVRTGDGELWVSVQAWANNDAAWSLWIKHGNQQLPTATALGRALASLSGDTQRQIAVKSAGKSTRNVFHRIDLGQLFAWAQRAGFGDIDAMRATVNGTPPTGTTPPSPPSTPPVVPPPSTPTHQPSQTVIHESVEAIEAVTEPVDASAITEQPRTLSEMLEARESTANERSIGVTDNVTTCTEPAESQGSSVVHSTSRDVTNGCQDMSHAVSTRVSDSATVANVDVMAQPITDAKPSKRAAKTRVRAAVAPIARASHYFTPTDRGPLAQLKIDAPRTEREADAWFAPIVREAVTEPGKYARLVLAWRRYAEALRNGLAPASAANNAIDAWLDVAPDAWAPTSCVRNDAGASDAINATEAGAA